MVQEVAFEWSLGVPDTVRAWLASTGWWPRNQWLVGEAPGEGITHPLHVVPVKTTRALRRHIYAYRCSSGGPVELRSPENEGPQKRSQNRPQNKKVWATLEGKEAVFKCLADQVRRRDGPRVTDRVTDRVALSDGCKALQDRFRAEFPHFELILDFVHVSEYLWDAANVLFPETDEARLDWVVERSRELLTGQHGKVLSVLRQASAHEASAHEKDQLARVARYFERNAERMDYQRYLARGWPIATGVIEGACRHLVKDRCEMSGMRWNAQGAEQVLGHRSVWTNGDWDAYHRHRREKRHRRLYGRPLEETDSLEDQMWRMAIDVYQLAWNTPLFFVLLDARKSA